VGIVIHTLVGTWFMLLVINVNLLVMQEILTNLFLAHDPVHVWPAASVMEMTFHICIWASLTLLEFPKIEFQPDSGQERSYAGHET
jgi:hypothetical protein